jgi:hypothetical protein
MTRKYRTRPQPVKTRRNPDEVNCQELVAVSGKVPHPPRNPATSPALNAPIGYAKQAGVAVDRIRFA